MAEFFSLPLNTDQYLADTTHLSTEEHGAYLLLEIATWRSKDCILPDDDAFLARLCRCTLKRWKERLRPKIEPFFAVADGAWTHRKLAESRAHIATVCEKRRAAANASHKAKPLENKESPPAYAGANGGANAPLTKTITIQEETRSPIETQTPIPESETHTNKGEGVAGAPPVGGRRYAFEGTVIKLNRRHYDEMLADAPHVAVSAELRARDEWLASERATDVDRKSWFPSTRKHIANLEQKALDRRAAAEAERVARCGTQFPALNSRLDYRDNLGPNSSVPRL